MSGSEGAAAAGAGRGDQRVTRAELVISRILRGGVVASLALIVAGTALTFAHHPEYLSRRMPLGTMAEVGEGFPRTVGGVARGVLGGQGRAVVVLGLLALIATPVLRVAVSIGVFASLRDRKFVGLTTLVLLLLALSVALGRVEGAGRAGREVGPRLEGVGRSAP